MSLVETEHVLVVPAEVFHRLGHFQGFQPLAEDYLEQLLSPEHTSYRPRSEMEQDPGFKQLIPYVIFRHRDEQGLERVFQYTRGKGQGEGRLHSKRSVGVGGHISSVDREIMGDSETTDSTNPYLEGMRRELEEEVAIGCPYTSHCVGLINDDQTEVGRVHLGIVHLVDLEQPAVESREADILEAGFRPVDEILADLAGFETWSQICMQALFGERS